MNSPRPVVLLLFILLRLTSGGVAQYPQPVFEHLSIDHGLSQNGVSSILQDSRGTLWIGTWSGLLRRDSNTRMFSHYYHREDDSSSLALDIVNALLADRRDRLWVGLRGGGLDMLDLRRGRSAFRHCRHNASDSGSLCSNWVWTIFEDSKGRVWAGTNDGVTMFDEASSRFKNFLHNPADRNSLCDNNVFTIAEDSRLSIWFGTSAGLDRLDEATGVFEHYSGSDGLPSSYVYGILPDWEGNLWVSTNRGLARFSERKPAACTGGGVVPANLVPAVASQRNPQDTELNQPGTESSQ